MLRARAVKQTQSGREGKVCDWKRVGVNDSPGHQMNQEAREPPHSGARKRTLYSFPIQDIFLLGQKFLPIQPSKA